MNILRSIFLKLISNGKTFDPNRFDMRRIRAINAIGYTLAFLAFGYASNSLFFSITPDMQFVVPAILFLFIWGAFIIFQRHTDNIELLTNLAVALLVVVFMNSIIVTQFDSPLTLWVYVLPPFAFFLTGLRGGITWTIFLLVFLSIVGLVNHTDLLGGSIRDHFTLNLMSALIVGAFLLFQYERVRAQTEKNLSGKNNELQRLIYTVSHDLKTPVVSLLGYLSFVKEEIASGAIQQRDDDLHKMDQIIDNMRAMINDLLNLSRIKRAGMYSDVPTGDIIVKVIDELEPQITENNIQTKLIGTFPTIHTDQRKFEEIIRNLVSNAIKYMGKQPQPRITIGVQDQPRHYYFFCQDNGIGIDPQEMTRIFEPFYAKSDISIGQGVGLSIIKGFVTDLQGKIWVESEKGTGSTFWFSLPKTHKKN